MMIVYHELLPQAYLLVLAPDSAATSELKLARELSRAMHSGTASVWVDCRLLDTISDAAIRLLHACHHRLQRRQAQLVLCRVSGGLARRLASADLCLAPTFDEAAAQQCNGPFEG